MDRWYNISAVCFIPDLVPYHKLQYYPLRLTFNFHTIHFRLLFLFLLQRFLLKKFCFAFIFKTENLTLKNLSLALNKTIKLYDLKKESAIWNTGNHFCF